MRVAELGPGFIRRVYAASSILGLLGAMFVSVYAGWNAGAAWLMGLAVSLMNFRVLQYALARLLRPEPQWNVAVVLAVAFKVPLLLATIFVALQVLHLPALWFSFGFFLLFLVIVLKALGRLLHTAQLQRAAERSQAAPAPASDAAERMPAGAAELPRARASSPSTVRPGQSVGLRVREALGAQDEVRSPRGVDKKRMLILGTLFALALSTAGTLASLGTQWMADRAGWSTDVALAETDPHAVAAQAADPHTTGTQVADPNAPGTHAGGTTDPGHDAATGHGAAHGDGHGADATAHPDGHGDAHVGDHGEAHGDHGGHDAYHFPTIFWFLKSAFPAASWLDRVIEWETVIFSVFVAIFLAVVARAASRNPSKVPGKLQNVVEMAVEGFDDFVRGIIGPEGRRYVPFIGTLFFYIWFMNLFGLVPGGFSPTSVYDTTLALALCVFLYVQFIALTRLGPKNYLLHLAGDPKDVSGWAVAPLQLPLHIIGEIAKPVSLSLRLFGNIMGEDKLLAVFAVLGAGILAFQPLPIGLPLHLPFMFLALLASTVQAFIFALLTTIYIFQVLPHEHDHGEEQH